MHIAWKKPLAGLSITNAVLISASKIPGLVISDQEVHSKEIGYGFVPDQETGAQKEVRSFERGYEAKIRKGDREAYLVLKPLWDIQLYETFDVHVYGIEYKYGHKDPKRLDHEFREELSQLKDHMFALFEKLWRIKEPSD